MFSKKAVALAFAIIMSLGFMSGSALGQDRGERRTGNTTDTIVGAFNLSLTQTNVIDLPANAKYREVENVGGVVKMFVEATTYDWWDNGTNAVRVNVRAFCVPDGSTSTCTGFATYPEPGYNKFLGTVVKAGVAYVIYQYPVP